MKLANVQGRACVIDDRGGVDLAAASGDRFSSRTDDVLPVLAEVMEWFDGYNDSFDPALSADALQADLARLDPPITRPPQVFAIGLNYGDHAAETGLDLPEQPMVFTKFMSSLAGAAAVVSLPAETVDWEVELVAVVGKGGRSIGAGDALDHIAGFCVGQDLSERRLQMASTPAQFSVGKSLEGFSPIGPWMTTLDELADPGDLSIECHLGDEVLQSSRTTNLIFDVVTLVEYLSAHVGLQTGDLIFTGTPAGVGVGRRPRRFIEPGWEITSTIEGLGSIITTFTD